MSIELTAKVGTYVLVMRCDTTSNIQVGRWGVLDTKPGYYLYVGSAFGPGGLKARVSRHCREQKTRRWHIDYLRELVEIKSVWYSEAPEHLEHKWAQVLSTMEGLSGIKGFGCSDCKCSSHLFSVKAKPEFADFSRLTGVLVKEMVC